MIEGKSRKQFEKFFVTPYLDSIPLNPSILTLISLLTGISTLPLLFFEYSKSAFCFLLLSGFLDIVDGSLARKKGLISDKGAAFDLISDRMVETAVLIGLYLVEPAVRAFPTILMLSSVYLCTCSFFIVSMFSNKNSEKSFYYSPGIIERAEAFLFFGAMILLPKYFGALSYSFSFLVFLTAFIRMNQYRKST